MSEPCGCRYHTLPGFVPHPGTIEFCPLHAAAGELLGLVREMRDFGLKVFAGTFAPAWFDRAEALIAMAEGHPSPHSSTNRGQREPRE